VSAPAAAETPGAPTAERMARGRFVEGPAIGTEAEPARAGARMYRAVPTIERLRRDGSITSRQADAGVKLRDDHELGVCGARDVAAGHSGGSLGCHFALAQLAAVRRWNTALAALGPRLEAIVRPIAVGLPGGGEVTIVDLARALGRNRQEIAGQLKLGLDVLGDHYGLAP
jgi:hypothetical protein